MIRGNEIYKKMLTDNVISEIFSEVNSIDKLKAVLVTILITIKKITGCQAIGIRLLDKNDYPYFVIDGFSKEFVLQENYLCSQRGGDSSDEKDGNHPKSYCICESVLTGHFDKSSESFTQYGSFWSNALSEMEFPKENPAGQMRGTCLKSGYKSMALIPVKSEEGILGIIQLNDRRVGIFNLEMIELVETIAQQIGRAIQISKARHGIRSLEKTNNEAETGALSSDELLDLSHEIRTPLNVIMTTVQLLDTYLDRGKLIDRTDRCDYHFRTMRKNCNRLMKLMSQLLDMKKIS